MAALVAVLVVGVGSMVALRGTTVQVVAVVRGDIAQSVVATGRISSPVRVDLTSEVNATVDAVLVREGDPVKAGQVLVRLRDAEARAALAQARATLAEADSRVQQQRNVTAPVARQSLAQAQATLEQAEREFERARTLVAQGFFAPQRQEEAQRALDMARGAHESARVQYLAQQEQGIEPLLALQRQQQARAALDATQARFERLTLVSPMDGVVLQRNAEPGGAAPVGRALLTLVAAQGLRIDASLDERHLHLLRHGMLARAVADAFAGQAFDARLTYIAPAVDPQRGTVDVRLDLLQPPAFLRPDMTVSVELVGERRDRTLVLPSMALRDMDRERPWVLVVRDGRAVRVDVQLGLRGVGSVEVIQGLAEGELVITQTEKALAGDRVRPKPVTPHEKGMDVPGLVR